MADDASGDLKTAGKTVIPLWPDGPPSVIEGVGAETTYEPRPVSPRVRSS